MHRIEIQYFRTRFGELILGSYDAALVLCDWRYRKMRNTVDARIRNGLNAACVERDNPLLAAARAQLDEYFARDRKTFDIPLRTVGTDFQQRVWDGLLNIPFGETRSYRQLADELGAPDAVRAVAGANGANALSIFIPCHRIIGSNGKLVGYAGGLKAKERLLDLEFDLFQ